MTGLRTIKLITFDAYNTLFKPTGSISAQYVEEASRFGIHVTKEQISQQFRQAYKNQITKAPFYGIHQGMTPNTWWREIVYSTFIGAGIQPKDLDHSFDHLFESINNRFATAEAYTIFPDVIASLNQLKNDGYKMGIISNSDERIVDVIKNLRLYEYFDFVLTSSMAGYEKPDKKIYEQALKLAGNMKPTNALHIGDDAEKDYFGAIHAGWHAILLERNDDLDFTPAMIVDSITPDHRPKEIVSLVDLDPFINKLNSILPEVEAKEIKKGQFAENKDTVKA